MIKKGLAPPTPTPSRDLSSCKLSLYLEGPRLPTPQVCIDELVSQPDAHAEPLGCLAVTPPPPSVSLQPLDVAVLLGILAVEGALIVAGLWR